MDLQQMIDDRLLKESQQDRERSGKYSPSLFGNCFRRQFLNRCDVKPSNPLDIKTLHIFKAGHIVHEYLQSFFSEEKCEVKMEDDHFIGYADIDAGMVIDIKSVNPAYFFYSRGKGSTRLLKYEIDERIKSKKLNNIMQVTHYGDKLGKDVGALFFVSRDLSYGLDTHTFIFDIKEFVPIVKKERDTLVDIWEKGELPPKAPRLYDGKECQYCPYHNACKEDDIDFKPCYEKVKERLAKT